MNAVTNAGVWMDHLTAKIIEDKRLPKVACIIRSISEGRIVRERGEGSSGIRLGNYRSTNNEHHTHNIAREELKSYFKNLAKALLPYDTIFLFGPTTAPDEFFNFLLKDRQFKKKRIFVRRTNYMTDNQVYERVRDFFHPLWRIPRMPLAYRTPR